MLIHNFLENSAALYPDKIAVIHDSKLATYQQINTQANTLAKHFLESRICKGDRIVLLLENSIDYIVAYYAALKAGAVVAALNPGVKPDGLLYLLNDLEPSAIITNFKSERLLKAIDLDHLGLKSLIIRDPKQKWGDVGFPVVSMDYILNAKALDNQSIPLSAEDLSSIVYTSGSTGRPKGVMLSHKNIVSNTRSICQYLTLTSDDIQMVVLPLFYVMGKSLLNTHFAVGGTVVINNRFMYPADVLNQMIAEKVTGLSGVPSTYAYLLHKSPLAACKEKLVDLRYCSQAGGHMAASLKKALRKTLPAHTQIYIMYGATEASARLTYLHPKFFDTKIESIGKPIPGVQIRILDEQNREVPEGIEGSLVAAGPNIMMGYWKDPVDTRRVLGGMGYHTGDIGYRDSEGFLYVTGRKDGLLKVSGHRVNPVEIEDFLLSTDLLVETAVIGLPDSLLGNKLIALVVPKDETFAVQSLIQRCAGGLPNHKSPSVILPVRALPKNANGKVDRDQCIRMASDPTL